ncbi:MAG: hypothetical protein ACK2UK_00420 [Candidatus Promineifilaceae bacterium]
MKPSSHYAVKVLLLPLVLATLLLSGCRAELAPLVVGEPSLSAPDRTTAVPWPTAPAPILPETIAHTPTTFPVPSPTASPQDLALQPASTATATPAPELDILSELSAAMPPVRDDVRLVEAFRGVDPGSFATPHPALVEPLQTGTRQTFTVLDVENNRVGEIEADLLAIGDHAYFWFEMGPFAMEPDAALLAAAVSEFDAIYENVTAQFGSEASPGIDGDPRLHILHASPQTICGVPADRQDGCGIAGFVSFADLQPAAINPQSNEREMFVMNGRYFGSDFYLGVLAHEFRHMIESNYSESDVDWEKEGSAVLASELAGQVNNGVARANEFLAAPDQQLNSWAESGVSSYYGQGYLFNQYIYDRLGGTLYRTFATSPLPGFLSLDALSDGQGDTLPNGEMLWLDWLVALVLHEHPQANEKYRFSIAGLDTAAFSSLEEDMPQTVFQYAADYYHLPLKGGQISFSGDTDVSLLAGQPASAEQFWYAQRANYSNPRLTRALDLGEVESATLLYDVYTDIEAGYDFAYVSASTDGGQTWTPLAAEHMQGLDPKDDPSASALAQRFYSGRDQTWRSEQIDLSPFAGQEILLRFEMVTDPILTYSGLAVDHVAVPEIGYEDDESGDGWIVEGFTLAPATIPQPWRLQLIEFTVDGPLVTAIPVNEDGTASISFRAGNEEPILIVAAAAPTTLEPARYQLSMNE